MGCCFGAQDDKPNSKQPQMKNQPPPSTQRTLRQVKKDVINLNQINPLGVDELQKGITQNINYNNLNDISSGKVDIKFKSKGCINQNSSLTNTKQDFNNETNASSNAMKTFGKSNTIISDSTGNRLSSIRPSYISQDGQIPSLFTEMQQDEGLKIVIIDDKLKIEQVSSELNISYYHIINKKMYIKKNFKNVLRVKSPSTSCNLYCQNDKIKQTLFITEGIPIENICLKKTNNIYMFFQNNYEIEIFLKLKCEHCLRVKKYYFSVCKILLNFVCECQQTDFELQNIQAKGDIPLWLNNTRIKKIDGKLNVMYQKQGFIRGMGCVYCLRFEGCTIMQCGCWLCNECQKCYLQNCNLHNKDV